jgi:hypothetical protein
VLLDAAVLLGIRTIALGISPDLVHQGVVDLTGYQVRSAEDLARLGLRQLFQSLRGEAGGLKGDKLVGQGDPG